MKPIYIIHINLDDLKFISFKKDFELEELKQIIEDICEEKGFSRNRYELEIDDEGLYSNLMKNGIELYAESCLSKI